MYKSYRYHCTNFKIQFVIGYILSSVCFFVKPFFEKIKKIYTAKPKKYFAA